MVEKFWEKPLTELSREEWESLCDGCGQCCLKSLEDESSGEIAITRVVCRHHDQGSGACGSYNKRQELVPDCLDVSTMDIGSAPWMPETCAYRLRYEGKPLESWHPLIAGDREAMIDAGIALAGAAINEDYVHPDGYDEHILRWVQV